MRIFGLNIDPIHWIKGWRLDKFFNELFHHKNEEGDVILTESLAKGIMLAKNLKEWLANPLVDLFTAITKGDWVEKDRKLISDFLDTWIAKLTAIKTIPDVAVTLKDYKFSDNFEEDKFYHDFATLAANSFSDGKFSFADLSLGAQLMYDYLKEKKKV